jgi:hypothetical protein
MSEDDFSEVQRGKMVEWRKTHIGTSDKGTQNGIPYVHIIPKLENNGHLSDVLYNTITTSLPSYLKEKDIQAHTGTNNLLSSWVLAANLYFPIKHNEALKKLMVEFLKQKVSDQIIEISDVELEFAFPEGNELHPSRLLGEIDGSRGSGQTSPDVAFCVKTNSGEGLVLTECKYTEHSFYACSARTKKDKPTRINNPDPSRCLQSMQSCDYKAICHQTIWGRKYLKLLTLSVFSKSKLTRCPAATAGYQLIRQQALAEGIAQSNQFSLVASCVAFDARNTDLIGCLKSTGIADFQTEWAKLFTGKAIFKTWHHQEWIQFVRENQMNGEFEDWLEYLKLRYQY